MIHSLDKLLSFLVELERFTDFGRGTRKTLQGFLKNIEKLIKSIKAWIDASKNVVVLFTLEGKVVHENVSVGVVVTEVDMEAVVDTKVEEETVKFRLRMLGLKLAGYGMLRQRKRPREAI